MSEIVIEEPIGVFSLARTKRRRFLWCAWWTTEPAVLPFRAPDAWNGGARTEDEARALAERAAGGPLRLIEGRWARAWVRVRAGLPPFIERDRAPSAVDEAKPRVRSAREVLGVPARASMDEVKLAFRKKALEHHPDHGGTPESFIAVKRAYDSLVRRNGRPPPRRRRK